LPPDVDDELAAATLLKGITADLLLRDLGHVGAGTRLLVHAAAGGVGLLVCAWASRLGATVIGTVSSEEKARVAREYGCAHPIVTREPRFAQAVQAEFGGADVLVDGIGDAARDENFAALARRGHWISRGQASGALQPIAADQLVQKSITFSRPAVFDYVASRAALAERAARIWAALADGTLKAPPIERHALGAAAEAHARLESRRTIGALVLIA
jgi:NADPH:quinone reductase-like Zn-dependent oxidoreductase